MPANDAELEQLEFVGVAPKNKLISETIRRSGYIAVMLNEDDFFSAVVWATNAVDRFETSYKRAINDRICIPVSELKDIEKPMLISAYMILLIHYSRKGNAPLVSSLKDRLMNVAKFQYMPAEHVKIMANWDTYMADVRRRMGVGDFSAPDMKDVSGTKDTFDHYRSLIKKEQKSFEESLKKEKIS